MKWPLLAKSKSSRTHQANRHPRNLYLLACSNTPNPLISRSWMNPCER
jgi:hypothetical protein